MPESGHPAPSLPPSAPSLPVSLAPSAPSLPVSLAPPSARGIARLQLREGEVPVEHRGELLLAIEDALGRLAELNPRLVRVVECLFFGGMTQEEAAQVLGITDRTVRSDWRIAKAFLVKELSTTA